jgi:hypothetical protein
VSGVTTWLRRRDIAVGVSLLRASRVAKIKRDIMKINFQIDFSETPTRMMRIGTTARRSHPADGCL